MSIKNNLIGLNETRTLNSIQNFIIKYGKVRHSYTYEREYHSNTSRNAYNPPNIM